MKAIVFFVTTIVSFHLSLKAEAVMNGRPADPESSAATIYVSPQKEGSKKCTAVIVDPHLLFLAAHCTEGMTKTVLSIKASNSLDGRSPITLHVLQWRTKPGYKQSDLKQPEEVQYDFAFFRVRENLVETFGLKPGQIPQVVNSKEEMKEALSAAQGQAIAYGYGYFKKWREGEKREVKQSAVVFEKQTVIKATSTENDIGLCEGDSGGGLFVEDNGHLKLLGNVSGIVREKDCGATGSYALYSMVYMHLCWIQKTSGIQVGNPQCEN